MIQQYGGNTPADDITSICKDLKLTGLYGNFDIVQYVKDFERAMMTFKHQVIFDPQQQMLVNLTPLPKQKMHL